MPHTIDGAQPCQLIVRQPDGPLLEVLGTLELPYIDDNDDNADTYLPRNAVAFHRFKALDELVLYYAKLRHLGEPENLGEGVRVLVSRPLTPQEVAYLDREVPKAQAALAERDTLYCRIVNARARTQRLAQDINTYRNLSPRLKLTEEGRREFDERLEAMEAEYKSVNDEYTAASFEWRKHNYKLDWPEDEEGFPLRPDEGGQGV